VTSCVTMVIHVTFSMRTLAERTVGGLLTQLAQLAPSYRQSFVAFALGASSKASNSELSTLVSRLTSLSTQSIGCLTAPLVEDGISCSLAAFPLNDCVPFRSTVSGTPVPRVGRWHAFPNSETNNSDSDMDIRKKSVNDPLDDLKCLR
jgi:hypothetical protein